jgi:hypothetical protein
MGTVRPFQREKLIIGILVRRPDVCEPVIERLEREWGETDYRSRIIDFTFTDYYDSEMGSPLKRLFLSFDRLVLPELLSAIKTQTNAIEDKLREGGARTVNLDPGILNLSRLILATTKDGSHRIPLQAGIYAEVTLVYERGRFKALEWTYPDFRSPAYQTVLQDVRQIYRDQLKAMPMRKGSP